MSYNIRSVSLTEIKIYHAESKLYLVCFGKYILNLLFILSWFLVNDAQTLYVDLGLPGIAGYRKYILGTNSSRVNKNVFTISLVLI